MAELAQPRQRAGVDQGRQLGERLRPHAGLEVQVQVAFGQLLEVSHARDVRAHELRPRYARVIQRASPPATVEE